jgi:hypothetical protein
MENITGCSKRTEFLLVPRFGLILCRIWDVLSSVAGVAATQRKEKH